jgi:hypothetical protein
MNTTLGSDGAIAIDPAVEVGSFSVTHFHDSPQSVDLQTPPEAVAAR